MKRLIRLATALILLGCAHESPSAAPPRAPETTDQVIGSCAAGSEGTGHCLYLAQQLYHLLTRDLDEGAFWQIMNQIRAGETGGLPPDAARAARAVLLDGPLEWRYQEWARLKEQDHCQDQGGPALAQQNAFAKCRLVYANAVGAIPQEARRELLDLADRLEAAGRPNSSPAPNEADAALSSWRASRPAGEAEASDDDTREFSLVWASEDKVGQCLDYPAVKVRKAKLVVHPGARVLEYELDRVEQRRAVLLRQDGPEWVGEETIAMSPAGRRVVRWRLTWESNPIHGAVWSTDYAGGSSAAAQPGRPRGACRVEVRFTGNLKIKRQ